MSLVLNHNMMAANTARNLNVHYGRLATSTQRLSSGLRINSAADDAAGLAIRELQRADIAALHQGARNANDAVSMIQVADGSLSIIDEKLIRMKELAEQAATGTYDSTQRLMIESEYQAMASEITRIANATDFNGIKLLDGSLAGEHDGSGLTAKGEMKIHFGTGNDSAEDYYYVEIGECTSEAFGIGNASTWQDVQKRAMQAFKTSLAAQIKNDSSLTAEERTVLLGQIEENAKLLEDALNFATDPTTAFLNFTADDAFPGSPALKEKYMTALNDARNEFGVTGKGWPTTSPEIIDKITWAMESVNKPAFDTLYPNDMTDYANALKAAANQAGNRYGVPATVINGIIDNEITKFIAANNGNPPNAYEKGGILKTSLQASIYNTLQTDTTLKNAIETQIKLEMNNAIDNVPLPNQADDGINSNPQIYSPAYFEEYKSRVLIAAQNAAKALGLQNMTNLDAAFNAAPAPTQPITDASITAWKNSLKNSLSSNATFMTQMVNVGLGKIQGEIDNTRENYNYTLVSVSKSDAYKQGVVNAALNAATEIGVDTTNIQSLLNNWGAYNPGIMLDAKGINDYLSGQVDNIKTGTGLVKNDIDIAADRNQKAADRLNEFWNGLRGTEQQKFMYAWGQAAIDDLANGCGLGKYGIGYEKFTLGENLEELTETQIDALLSNSLKNMKSKVGHMDFAGFTIETQEDAQMALEAINAAIVSKDKIRSHLGATQNRLENTITNLNVMAENLQAAESRISDVDVATEMTNMVRNQILSQAATAMLAQANSLPQMAMQLIGG